MNSAIMICVFIYCLMNHTRALDAFCNIDGGKRKANSIDRFHEYQRINLRLTTKTPKETSPLLFLSYWALHESKRPFELIAPSRPIPGVL